MVELKESKVVSSINKLPYDRTSQLALLEAIEKVQQRIKEVDDLDSQSNLVHNRKAYSDLDEIIIEIIERVKKAKTLQQEIKMNEKIIQTVKAAEKSNSNIELDQEYANKALDKNDTEVEQIFTEIVNSTTDDISKKNKVKFEDIQYSELSTDQEKVSIGIIEQNIEPETKQIKTGAKDTFFRVDETDSYIEYMKDSSASQYNPEEFVQVEWDNDLLELNAQIYRSIKSKRDYLSKREKENEKAKSMGKEAQPATGVALAAASQKSIQDFDKYFTQEDFTKVERAPDTTNDSNKGNKHGAPDGFKYTDKAIADMDEFSRQKQTRESQKKAKPIDKIKTRIKGGAKGIKSAMPKDQKPKTENSKSFKEKVLEKIQSVKKSRSDKKNEPVKTEQFVKSKKSKKPKIKLEDLKKKIRK